MAMCPIAQIQSGSRSWVLLERRKNYPSELIFCFEWYRNILEMKTLIGLMFHKGKKGGEDFIWPRRSPFKGISHSWSFDSIYQCGTHLTLWRSQWEIGWLAGFFKDATSVEKDRRI